MKKHKTSINYLKLPIFTGSKTTDKERDYIVEYEENGVKSFVEIKNGKLSTYHRKLFVCLEYLYMKQNPNFEREFVRTTFKDIQDTLNTKGNNHNKIISSLEDLQEVNIKSVIVKKIDDKIEKEEGRKFNLLPQISWNMTKQLDERHKEGVRKYTGHIDVYFQKFHIDNLKSNYYRLINFELIRRLTNNSVRLFDYLNLNSYYLKNGKYIQKKKVKFDYEDLILYLLLTKQKKNSYKERQFKKQCDELKEKGVIKSYKWEHDFFNSFLLINLSQSINLWGTYNPEQIENIEKLTPIQNKLKEYGVPPKQRDYISNGYSEEYIHNKLEQFEYITKNIPNKIKGRGSYIYNSIKNDWIEDSYTEYIYNQKQNELKIISRKQSDELDKLHNEYEEYKNTICLDYIKNIMTKKEKERIDIKVYEKLKEKKKFIPTSSYNFYKEIEILHIVEQTIDIPEYEVWINTHKG